MPRTPGRLSRLLAWPLLGLIGVYRLLISPWLGNNCRFTPSCSAYAMEALREHGVFRGCSLAAKRIARCHPWGESGYDPVPLSEADELTDTDVDEERYVEIEDDAATLKNRTAVLAKVQSMCCVSDKETFRTAAAFLGTVGGKKDLEFLQKMAKSDGITAQRLEFLKKVMANMERRAKQATPAQAVPCLSFGRNGRPSFAPRVTSRGCTTFPAPAKSR